MDSVASAALQSWALDGRVIAILLAVAFVYLRGWFRGRTLLRHDDDFKRLWAFLTGLAVVFIATESPLDALDNLFLSVHMTQHLLLMMVAPPLILSGHPTLPLLRGLPKTFVKHGLGPFLAWHPFRRFLRALVSLEVAWVAYAVSTIGWHLPRLYELALQSPFWHSVQHASFFWTGILFWWPVIRPVPGRPRWPQWALIPYLLSADVLNTALSAFFVFSGRVLYPTYEAVRASSISPQDDQTLAGAIMWVPGSIIYIVPAIVIAVRLFSNTEAERRARVRVHVNRIRIGKRHATVVLPKLRRVTQVAMLALAITVMADGFWGPQVAAVNLAGVLPWIHWRALSIFALLIAGNLFCMSCPFTLVRDIGRILLPAKLRWPRWLRTKWLSAALLVIYLWAYEAFSLWDRPWLTASLIAGYFLTILLIDGLFRGANFCKYVCPIGQFHFISSLVSPGAIRVRDRSVCQSCRTHDCIRGNEQARGCELYLFQPKKAGNLDCTFCMDCVKACPHDNVALMPVAPASTLTIDPYRSSLGRLSRRNDLAALALVFVFGAFANAASMIAPVMNWEHGWHRSLGAHAMPLIVGLFILFGVLMLPAITVVVCRLLNRLTQAPVSTADVARRFVFALVPVGFAMWLAHILFHFATGWNAAWPAFERALLGTLSVSPVMAIPPWLTSVQLIVLDAGLLLGLYVSWRVATQSVRAARTAVALVTPWAVASCGLYALGVWILFQPMQMRGMLH